MIRNVAAPTIIPIKFMSQKNLEDKFTKIILIPAAILLVHPVLPAPHFPAVLLTPFPSLCHKNRIRYILHCVLVYATRQNCSRDPRRDAPGDVFIVILFSVISFDPSYDPSSEPSCNPSCNPSCGTARANFLPLSINRIAAETHAGMLRATCSLQFCLRLSPSIIPKKQFAIGVYT